MQLVRAGPERIALGISERTGVPTVAARDGWLLPLGDLAAAARGRRGPEPAGDAAP
jgi:hypothetical protein